MRTVAIDFTGANTPVDFFAGYGGEANITRLTVCLPDSLRSDGIDYYRAHFKTAGYESLSSEKLYAENGVISFDLWYELTRGAGSLLMQISAYDFNGNELVRLGKTPVATLKIKPSIPSGAEGNPRLYGLEAELEKLIRLNDDGVCPLTVNTVSDLPPSPKQGALALVRNPPPPFLRQCAVPIIGNRCYPRLYINPYPPRPEHLYSGVELPFFEAVFRRVANSGETPTPTFGIVLFDGSDSGLPNMLQVMNPLGDGVPAYFYTWEDFDLGEGQRADPGWNILRADDENADLTIVEPVAFDNVPPIEYAGFVEEPSPYLGYYLSASPYRRETVNSLFVFDGSEWKAVDAEDISIKPVGVIPVRGVAFPAYGGMFFAGYTQAVAPAKVVPSFASNKGIQYSVSDETVITAAPGIDGDGYAVLNITCLTTGNATITASSDEGGYTATLQVVVQEV